jgi:hypothetical protein
MSDDKTLTLEQKHELLQDIFDSNVSADPFH